MSFRDRCRESASPCTIHWAHSRCTEAVMAAKPSPERWPSLPLAEWQSTYETLHRWTQIVGKVRLVQTPWINHCWNSTLYVTPSGLTTGPIPHGPTAFQIDFDF